MKNDFILSEPAIEKGDHPAGAQRVPLAYNGDAPEAKCREAISALLQPQEELPDTVSISLYHIRCLANGTIGEKKTHGVVFVPEFLYVLDFGFDRLAGVSIESPRQLNGDPYFPNFEKPEIRSIANFEPRSLLYPLVAGELMISFEEELDEDAARALLAGYVHQVSGANGFFEATCDLFREKLTMEAIKREVSRVRYVVANYVVRANDIVPGWYIDRVL